MIPRKITERIHWIGAIDWDARLFDALVPLPDGTSYNAYLVRGSEKTALIDTVDPHFEAGLIAALADRGPIDYVVANHAEQDHSGAIPVVLERYPDAVVLCSIKAKRMLVDLLGIDAARIRTVRDGEEVSLGDRTLRFVYTPWVHWPETMSTFVVEDRVLFSCDLFGAHLATSDLFAARDGSLIEPAKRYYAEIMMPFRAAVLDNVKKVVALDPAMIAPSHGPIHDDPAPILASYGAWAGAEPANRVVVAYVSMHNSTRLMVDALIDALIDQGIGADRFDLTTTDLGKLAIALVDAGTVVLAAPTVLEGPHPLAASCAFLVNALKPKAKFLAAIGSYTWNSKALNKLELLLADVEAEWLPPVIGRGVPDTDARNAIAALANTIAARHREAGLA